MELSKVEEEKESVNETTSSGTYAVPFAYVPRKTNFILPKSIVAMLLNGCD